MLSPLDSRLFLFRLFAAMPIVDRLIRQHRYQLIDIARGIAFVAMVIYHVCVFSRLYGYLDINIQHGLFWKGFQKSIAGSFFLLVGVSLYLANTPAIRARKYIYRLAKLIVFAGVVTVASVFLNPNAIVYFGILHSIAVCSVVGLLFLRFNYVNVLIGIAIITTGIWYSHPIFNNPALYWTGLGTYRILSFDFQPLFPWFGVVILGITAGRYLVGIRVSSWHSNSFTAKPLTLIGQHSLFLYMAHVPIIIATLEIMKFL